MERERTRQLATDLTDKRTQAQDKGVALRQWGAQALGAVPGIYNQSANTDVAGLHSANSLLSGAAQTPGFWDSVLNSAVHGAAQGASGAAVACMIAAACYGEYDLRFRILRLWINHVYNQGRIGKHVVAAYRKHGFKIAAVVKRNRLAKLFFTAVFNAVLRKAGRELKLIGGC